jgi:hypothetical protein
MLRIAAREAQIVSFVPQFSPSGRPMLRHATESALAERVAQVRNSAGAHFEHLVLDIFVADAGVVGGRQPLASSIGALVKSAGPAIGGGSPYLLYGSVEQLREAMLRRRERTGVSSYGIPARAMEAFAPIVSELSGR